MVVITNNMAAQRLLTYKEVNNKLWCISHRDNEILEVCEDCECGPICPECKSHDHEGHLVTELSVYLEEKRDGLFRQQMLVVIPMLDTRIKLIRRKVQQFKEKGKIGLAHIYKERNETKTMLSAVIDKTAEKMAEQISLASKENIDVYMKYIEQLESFKLIGSENGTNYILSIMDILNMTVDFDPTKHISSPNDNIVQVPIFDVNKRLRDSILEEFLSKTKTSNELIIREPEILSNSKHMKQTPEKIHVSYNSVYDLEIVAKINLGKCPKYISPVSCDKAWVVIDKTLLLADTKGVILRTIDLDTTIDGVHFDHKNDTMYWYTHFDRTIRKVNTKSGRAQCIHRDEHGLCGFAISPTEDIMTATLTDWPWRVITKYKSSPLNIFEFKNATPVRMKYLLGNYFVCLNDSLVMLNNDLKLTWSYNGLPRIEDKVYSFSPKDVMVTDEENIIVFDSRNKLSHFGH